MPSSHAHAERAAMQRTAQHTAGASTHSGALPPQDMTIDTRRKLYENVVLSGGCTMLPGLPTRLENELRALYLEHTLKAGPPPHTARCLRQELDSCYPST
jgi:actin-related protein